MYKQNTFNFHHHWSSSNLSHFRYKFYHVSISVSRGRNLWLFIILLCLRMQGLFIIYWKGGVRGEVTESPHFIEGTFWSPFPSPPTYLITMFTGTTYQIFPHLFQHFIPWKEDWNKMPVKLYLYSCYMPWEANHYT